MPMALAGTEVLERFLGLARAAVARKEWGAELAAGRALTGQEAATLLLSPRCPVHKTPA